MFLCSAYFMFLTVDFYSDLWYNLIICVGFGNHMPTMMVKIIYKIIRNRQKL